MNKRLLHILLVLLAATSCIYDYDVELDAAPERVVIEGDISLGEVCYFSAKKVFSLDNDPKKLRDVLLPEAVFTVEDEHGNVYTDKQQNGKEAVIDLSSAPVGRKYRLLVTVVPGEKEYSTPWMDPEPAPSIGELTETTVGDDLLLSLDLSQDHGSGCYRWDYEELFYYHTLLRAPELEYRTNNDGSVYIYDHFRLGDPETGHREADMNKWWGKTYCWKLKYSERTSVAIARALEGWKLERHGFLTIPLKSSELGLGKMYVKLKAKSIPEEEYRYLNAMNRSSEIDGSLLSPLPSDILGNLKNVADDTDYALGYVSVNTVASKIFQVKTKGVDSWLEEAIYYKNPFNIYEGDYQTVLVSAYNDGLYPYKTNNGVSWWVPLYCIDCRVSGGTIDKPAGWETEEGV